MMQRILGSSNVGSGNGHPAGRKKGPRPRRAGRMKIAAAVLAVINAVVVLGAVGVLLTGAPVRAQSSEGDAATHGAAPAENRDGSEGMKAMAAAVAIGIGALSAGIAVSVVGSAAVGGISRNPEIFGRSLVFVGLAEGIAIYGLIIAFMILTV